MQFQLSPQEQAIRARARELADALEPFELAVEAAGGVAPPELERKIRQICLDSGLFAPNIPKEHGGSGLTIGEQVLVEEQLGRLTNHIWAGLWRPYAVLLQGTAEQRAKYFDPYVRGEKRGCYAITEPGAGSDVSNLATVARAEGDEFVITGEKWFATGGDYAAFFLVVANVVGRDEPAPTVFIVDRDTPGLQLKHDLHFTNNSIYGHPEVVLDNVRVGREAILGEIGSGLTLTREWFREERLMIAARCLGAAQRCIELAHAFARQRVAFGLPIGDQQAIQWMLADSAVELAAARALVYRVAAEIEAGLDVKLAHTQASMVKLYASEMVGRVADRCLQIFGGRGYTRQNPVERLWRDTRVDRIWEGTSEIQRLIIARGLDRRGVATVLN